MAISYDYNAFLAVKIIENLPLRSLHAQLNSYYYASFYIANKTTCLITWSILAFDMNVYY